jgi:multisubunit Na+/H+ antiporter MnhB subunit
VVTLVILIRATLGRDEQMVHVSKPLVGVAFAAALVAVIGLFGMQVLTTFPEFGIPVMDRLADAPSSTYLLDGLADTGAPNIVTAVLLDFRAWDTLGEATVLFCAALGTVAILRRRARGGSAKDDNP